jgi:nucleoside-diphosphate-sugar epimerase
MANQAVGVLGASSLVGEQLLRLLLEDGLRVVAYSRNERPSNSDNPDWKQLGVSVQATSPEHVPLWICAAPVWVLPEHFQLLEAHGAQRIVIVSSTSRFTKDNSPNEQEQAVARRLADAESALQTWAAQQRASWIILRPTLIYGLGRDKNISEIARFIRRFGFFPVIGKAHGLRQPIHVNDVAKACTAAMHASNIENRSYNISGADTLQYRHMITQVFTAMRRSPVLLPVPLMVFQICLFLLKLVPRYRSWNSAMAERMNQDLVFEHSAATRDFAFSPKGFNLDAEDIAE